jgi:hypothetical protein
MKKLIGGVKWAFPSGPSSRGSGSGSDDGSQDSTRSLSFMPWLHQTPGLIRYLAHDDVPMATDNEDISICSTEEMEKYESHSCIWCELAQEGWNGWRASPHPLDYWLGKTLWRESDDSSDGWMTLQSCKWKCNHPLTHRPAWFMTSSITSAINPDA